MKCARYRPGAITQLIRLAIAGTPLWGGRSKILLVILALVLALWLWRDPHRRSSVATSHAPFRPYIQSALIGRKTYFNIKTTNAL